MHSLSRGWAWVTRSYSWSVPNLREGFCLGVAEEEVRLAVSDVLEDEVVRQLDCHPNNTAFRFLEGNLQRFELFAETVVLAVELLRVSRLHSDDPFVHVFQFMRFFGQSEDVFIFSNDARRKVVEDLLDDRCLM
jgi:hypothetical protein